MTDGRASQSISSDAAEVVARDIQDLIRSCDAVEGQPLWQHMLPMDQEALRKALSLQAFGLAAGHVSHAKAELHHMSCWRWSCQGTREVAFIGLDEAMSENVCTNLFNRFSIKSISKTDMYRTAC